MTAAQLALGFGDPVHDAQATFRAAMDAIARPGSIHRLVRLPSGPNGLAPATAALALTLFDHDTPIWLDPRLAASEEIGYWLRFHTGARLTGDTAEAAYALVSDAAHLLPLDRFAPGTLDYPDRSTTLVVEIASLDADQGWQLTGPGIKGTRHLQAEPLPPGFLQAMRANHALFPRGVDLFLTAGERICALPRTTRLQAPE